MERSPAGAFDRHGIRLRVVLLVACGVLAPWLILGGLAASAMSELGRRAEASQAALAQALAGRIESAIRHDLESLSSVVTANPFETGRNESTVRAALRAVVVQSRLLDGAAVLDPAGRVVMEEPPRDHVASALLSDPRAAASLASDRPVVLGPLASPDGVPRAFLLVPVHDWSRREVGCVAGISSPRNPGWNGLLGSLAGSAGHAVSIVDASGAAVMGERGPAGGHLAAIAGTPWTLVVREAEVPIAGMVRRFRTKLLVLGPLLLGAALVFAWGAARSLRQPLAILETSARRIAEGKIEEPIPRLGADEVGSLGESLEIMRRALEDSMTRITQANQLLEARVAERTRELERLNVELRLKDELRGKLLRKTITAQEEERKRIARELHDETCQTLTVLGMQLEAAASAADPSGKLAEAKAMSKRTLEEVHRLIFDLRPSMLDDLGLVPALRWFAKRRLEPKGIAVRFELDEVERRLPPEVETTVFRAVQEVLTNVERHAEADSVLVELSIDDDRLEIRVEDDGRGFDPRDVETSESGRGLGLMGLRERMELLGGSATIDAAPDAGTRVTLTVPLSKEAVRA